MNFPINMSDPNNIYTLGLLWADGYIKIRPKLSTYDFRITSTLPDALEIEKFINKNNSWHKYSYKNKKYPHWRQRVDFQQQNKDICIFLKNFGYLEKSNSPNSLLVSISDELKHYWYLGFSDGDGCFYINEKKGLYRFSAASNINQDWLFFENLCRQLDINYKIERTKSKAGSYSKIHISRKENVNKLGQFLYKDYSLNNIGLNRKYNKYLQITKKIK